MPLPRPTRLRLLALLFSAMIPATAFAQAHQETPVAATGSNEESEVPQVPGLSGLLRGGNVGVTISGVHDSVNGWTTIVQPAFGYSFNDHLSLDITIPIYQFRLTDSLIPSPKPNALLIPQHGARGDTIIGLHAQFVPRLFNYEGTVSVTAPSGDEQHGLSSGRATFDFNNLLQRDLRFVAPEVELGVGDSTSLVNRLVNKNYTTLGPIAHFQLGLAFPLPLRMSFEAGAYEVLPIGDQKIYQSVTRKGTTSAVVTGRNVAEDNGFTTTLDIPLNSHTTLSGYYNRSLREHDDIASIAMTYVLRGNKESTDTDK